MTNAVRPEFADIKPLTEPGFQWLRIVGRNAEFDFKSGALTNPRVFGSLTGATNSARRIQLAARFTF